MEALRASWGQMIAAIMRALNETQNQILIRDSKGLSEEQITEYRKSFNHFDKVGVVGFNGVGGMWAKCYWGHISFNNLATGGPSL